MSKKPKPKYGYQPEGFLEDHPLSNEEISRLRDLVDDDAFIGRMELITSLYLNLAKEDLEKPRPSEIRAALDDLETKIFELRQAFTTLDSETSDLLHQTIMEYTKKLPPVPLLPREHERYLQWFEGMVTYTRLKYSVKKHKDQASRFLAGQVAELLLERNIALADSVTGDFSKCLQIVSGESPDTVRNWIQIYLGKK